MAFCGNCGNELKEGATFCQYCGTKVGSETSENTNSYSQSKSTNTREVNMAYKMQDIVPEVITPSEGEQKIKQYHCTHLKSKLLGLSAEGVLQVTNKRTIFRASGRSITGNSIIQSEVPIEDVSGISVYKGTYFSLKHFILAILLLLFSNSIYTSFLGIFTLTKQDAASAVEWIFAIGSIFGIFAIPRKYIWNSMLGGIATCSFSMIAGSSFLSNSIGFGNLGGYGKTKHMEWVAIFALIFLIYTLIALFLYSRRLTMSLSIGSKGGSSTPINISGVSSWGFANSAAPKAIESEPTEETEILIKELGALIMDIQKLGDYGIEKWTSKH